MLIVDFNAGKTQLALFDCLNNYCAIDMEMMNLSLIEMLGLSVSSQGLLYYLHR